MRSRTEILPCCLESAAANLSFNSTSIAIQESGI
jgi:hypothetical protein